MSNHSCGIEKRSLALVVPCLLAAACAGGDFGTDTAAQETTRALITDPDLEVRAVSGPPSAHPYGNFEVIATVCNQGQSPSYGTDVQLMLSTDDTIDTMDMYLGSAPVPMLAPGACADLTIPGYASGSQGPLVLGAIVDPYDSVIEHREDNNALAGSIIGIGYDPDLYVAAISAPASALPYGSFEVTVTVCNQGQSDSYGADLMLVLSADDTIDVMDMDAGHAPVNVLWSGACTEVVIPGYASEPQGAHVLGAIVDPYDGVVELREDNNARAGDIIGIGYGPDLHVAAISAPPSAHPYGSFEATATVCNQGQGPSYGAHLEMHLSTDHDITPQDPPAGGSPVPVVEPGACATVTIPVYAPVDPGAYILGAIVDAHGSVPELREDNNAFAGDIIGIGHDPDLYVAAISAPPSAQPGASFDATMKVCNQGQGPSYGVHVDVHFSTDDVITPLDAPAGGAHVPGLEPGACATVTAPVYVPVDPGAYVLGAIVDVQDGIVELREDNNALAGGIIGIGHEADLYVASIGAPPSAQPYANFEVAVKVCNQGQGPSSYAHVEVFLSEDEDISHLDEFIGADSFQNLQPGQCITRNVPAAAYGPEGAYVLGVMVDGAQITDELREDNNTLAGEIIGIGHQPDLHVAAISAPPSATPGTSLDISVEVCNQGQSTSQATGVDVMLSPDGHIDEHDQWLGSAPVDPLAPGACAGVLVHAYASAPEGLYTLGALVDSYHTVPELIETNNATAGALLAVGHDADLVIEDVTAPASVTPGSGFQASIRVCNRGQRQSDPTNVELRLSADEVLDELDGHAGMTYVESIAPGACATVILPAYTPVPEDGAYVLGAIVDPHGYAPELIESNNTHTGSTILVGHDPDLVVASVIGPDTVIEGGSFDVTVEVCNQGQSTSYGTDVEVLLASGGTIDGSEPPLAHAWIQAIMPGTCHSVTVPAFAGEPAGSYVLGARVDPHDTTPEILETNNTGTGASIEVTPW